MKNKIKHSRIDFMLITRNMERRIDKIYYKMTSLSDHGMLMVHMNNNINNNERERMECMKKIKGYGGIM